MFKGREARSWESRAALALHDAKREVARADSLARWAGDLSLRSDSMERAARAARSEIRTRVVEVRSAPVPAAAIPYTAPRDSIIDQQEIVLQGAFSALDTARAARAAQVEAFGQLRVTTDSLRVVLAAHPRARSRWIPEVTVGPFIGVCTSSRPCAGAGVSLSWRVF